MLYAISDVVLCLQNFKFNFKPDLGIYKLKYFSSGGKKLKKCI